MQEKIADCKFIGMEARQEEMTNKLDMVSMKCDVTKRKVDDLAIYVKWSGNEMNKRINKLQDAVDTVIVVMQKENILPIMA